MTAVLYERRGAIAVLTLNRPEAHNALNPEIICRLADRWQEIRDDSAVRVAVITGAGEQTFCSGADLVKLIPLMTGARQPEDEWDRRVAEDAMLGNRALLRNFDVEKPVLAAVNGSALAGGMELLIATDIRVATQTARFALREAVWGLFPIGGSTVRLPRQIPQAAALEIMLTGDFLSAERAYALGLINHLTPPGETLAKTLELAERIAANGPLAVQAIRRSVRAAQGLPEQQALERELEIGLPVFATRDAREGPRAFKEKRPPKFEGR